jgi:hypothetical protein
MRLLHKATGATKIRQESPYEVLTIFQRIKIIP